MKTSEQCEFSSCLSYVSTGQPRGAGSPGELSGPPGLSCGAEVEAPLHSAFSRAAKIDQDFLCHFIGPPGLAKGCQLTELMKGARIILSDDPCSSPKRQRDLICRQSLYWIPTDVRAAARRVLWGKRSIQPLASPPGGSTLGSGEEKELPLVRLARAARCLGRALC